MAETAKSLGELKPNPQNPRRITDKKLAMLSESLRRFGDLGGVVVNVANGARQLVGGHQRIKALPDGAEIVITFEHPKPTRTGTVREGYVDVRGERFAYREVDWDENTERAANLAANKGAGEFDLPAVVDWMADLDASGFELDLTMFDSDERDALTPQIEEVPAEPDPSEDDVPELPPEPTAKPGDIWQLGKNRLMCGDSSNVQHIDALMDGQSADMVYTDPPYGMRLDCDNSSMKNSDNRHSKLKHSRIYSQVIGDDVDFDPGIIFGRFHDVPEILLWGADYYCQHLPKEGSWFVWDKRTKADGTQMGDFHGSHFELLWSRTKRQREISRILWMGLYQGPKEGARVHPTQKPVLLTEWVLDRCGKSGDVVVDLYGGSGSTLLACEKQGRKCYMMEIDPAYCDTICARFEKLTGQAAVLLSSGGAEVDNGGSSPEG